MSKPFLLFLEDERELQAEVIKVIETTGYEFQIAKDVKTALQLCRERPDIAVAIVDLRIGPENDFTAGWDFLEEAKLSSDTQVIVFTGHEDRLAVEALRRKPPKNLPYSYLLLRKDEDEDRLFDVLKQQLDHYNAKQTGGIIHESKEDIQRKADLPMIAASGLPVLITGPSGCGKEHVAQDIAALALPQSQHERIHTVNCAALTENIAIATLFGYAPGAYTGGKPKGDRGILKRITGTMNGTSVARGRVADADLPGILILDELAELPIFVQAQLLRMMQGQSINALGDSGEGYKPVIRVIACTNDEPKLNTPESFRQDLLGRFNGWHITIGSPRERKDTFLQVAKTTALGFRMMLEFGKPPIGISDVADDVAGEVAAKLISHEFPFGFRELIGWIGRACALALYREKNDTQLTAADLQTAWDRRMRLDDTGKKTSGKDETISVTELPETKVAEVRRLFERLMYGAGPVKESWDEQDLRVIATRVKSEDPGTYLALVELKKKYTTSDDRQRLLHLAINGMNADKTKLRKFVDRLRKYLGDTKAPSPKSERIPKPAVREA
jgi:DNA-binding NtrC family response regulator